MASCGTMVFKAADSHKFHAVMLLLVCCLSVLVRMVELCCDLALLLQSTCMLAAILQDQLAKSMALMKIKALQMPAKPHGFGFQTEFVFHTISSSIQLYGCL